MSTQTRNKPPPQAEPQNSIAGPQLLALSLFILLLAFFIVMTAVSSIDETKSRPIIESLERTFASKPRGDEKSPAPQPGPDFGVGQGHAFDRIESLFMAQIPNFEAKRLDGNATMFIRVPEDLFFEAVNPANQAGEGGESQFIKKLVVILNPAQVKNEYNIELYINLPLPINDLTLERPKDAQFAVRKAGQYGDIMVQNGLPEKWVSIGLHEETPGYVDLYFTSKNEVGPDPFEDMVVEPTPIDKTLRKEQEKETKEPVFEPGLFFK